MCYVNSEKNESLVMFRVLEQISLLSNENLRSATDHVNFDISGLQSKQGLLGFGSPSP